MHMGHFTTFFSAVSPAPGVGAQVELSRREPPPRAKLGRPAQVVVPGGGLFALANTLVRAIISRLHYARQRRSSGQQ